MVKYKQLILMVPGQVKKEDKMDFYQSLSAQGIYQTLNVAQKIKNDRCLNPEFIFTSTALYARQSAEIVHQILPKSELAFWDHLYAAHEKNLLHFLTHLDDIFSSLLLLSDAQGIQKLTVLLTDKKLTFSPSSSLCIHWPITQTWKTIDQNLGQLYKLWHP